MKTTTESTQRRTRLRCSPRQRFLGVMDALGAGVCFALSAPLILSSAAADAMCEGVTE